MTDEKEVKDEPMEEQGIWFYLIVFINNMNFFSYRKYFVINIVIYMKPIRRQPSCKYLLIFNLSTNLVQLISARNGRDL